jgi:pimeloyl-ACP methyl ester carboxylesterase
MPAAGRKRIQIGNNTPLQDFASRNWRSLWSLLTALFWTGLVFAVSLLTASAQTPPPKSFHPPRSLPLTKFYDAPEPLPAGKPGELIHFEEADEYQLSYEVSAVRILYHSRSARGEDVAVSGVVLLPEGKPPAGGWPIIAWAHGFHGSARTCAPSLSKNLNEGSLLSMYTSLGYAVVASDYAGLGTNFPHADLDVRSHALDVIYSVMAARAALPQLGRKWLVAGYSQGAVVSVAVAEFSGEKEEADYLGAIAISGLAEPEEFFARIAAQRPDYSPFLFLAHGINTVFREFRVEDMLTEKALRLYEEIGSSCEIKPDPELTANELLKPGWESNRYVKLFFARNTLNGKSGRGPVLVIAGDADPNVPAELTAKAVSRLCEQKNRVLFVKYLGLNGSAALSNSVSEQTSWIRARFAGLPAPGNCP